MTRNFSVMLCQCTEFKRFDVQLIFSVMPVSDERLKVVLFPGIANISQAIQQ